MSKLSITLEKFGELLKALDCKLQDANINLTVKAIGGFAMIVHAKEHNIKGREKSSDIDSLSTIPDDVLKMVALVGRDLGAEEDWLNNDWLNAKEEKEEFEYFARWDEYKEFNLKMIRLYILDIETMFFFKMRAIDEKIQGAEEPPRQQDIRDLYLILKIFDEHDMQNIKNTKMASCVSYFPAARDFMTGREP